MDARVRLGLIVVVAVMMLSTPRVACAQSQIPCRYEITHIIQGPTSPTWGAPATIGTSVSPGGRYVCGYYTYIGDHYAFLYDAQAQHLTTLPVQVSTFTFANDVNEEYVVGSAGDYGFLYRISTGQVTLLPPAVPIEQGRCTISAINANNVVCGTRTVGGSPNYPTSAFIWNVQSGFVDLGLINGQSTSAADINDAGVIIGRMNVAGVVHPMTWTDNQITDLGTLFGYETVPYSINKSNQVVGQSALVAAATSTHAFRWNKSAIVDLGTLPNHVNSRSFGIASDGLVAGSSSGASGFNQRAVIWTDHEIKDLTSMLVNISGVYLSSAICFDHNQNLLANGDQPNGTATAFILHPTLSPTADVNGDCRVNVSDLLLVINEWHKSDSPADVNHDGTVNVLDLLLVIENWSAGG